MERYHLPVAGLGHRALFATTLLLALLVAACSKGGATY
jgi:hypothetical protein